MKADHVRWLDAQDRKSLALGAADCAERVLTQFEKQNRTCDRPRKAIEAARSAQCKGEGGCPTIPMWSGGGKSYGCHSFDRSEETT